MGDRNKHGERAKIIPNPMETMRGYGWKPDELKQLFDGTHETMKLDNSVGALVRDVCRFWLQEQLPAISENINGLLEDGEAVRNFLCVDVLRACSKHTEL